ncbi:hypothetical protein [Lapidilactobacillus wuchangensis]|uniref:hypothetical protein n=1 Tax=Lapidilactobacillus wuchangensis TaxID=2486001 RepID=UPI000F7A9E2F|nr:hypothetical protein [Lapidilactobacillus wuchangensis]
MKKSSTLLTTLAAGLLALGLVGKVGVAQASTATPNPTSADTKDDTQLTASTDTSVTIKAGTISLYSMPDSIDFGSTDIKKIASDGFTSEDTILAGKVEDYRGTGTAAGSNTWTLQAKIGQWKDSTGTANDLMNAAATISVVGDGNNKIDKLSTDLISYTSGHEGITDITPAVSMKIDQGAFVNPDKYTNQIDWQLSTTVIGD